MGGLKIKKGDRVRVLTGKYRGKEGKILKACLLYTSPSPRDS